MLRMPLTARRTNRGGLGSALAMALALAGGAVVGTAVTDTPAHAQNSRGFAQVYEPLADVVEGATPATARGQIPALHAAIETQDDRYLAGNLTLSLGDKLQDRGLQRQGLEMILASGKADATLVPRYNYLAGLLAYDAKDFAAARTSLQAAIDAGFAEEDPVGLLAETYYGEGRNAEGIDYLLGAVQRRVAAGQPIEETSLRRAVQVAYLNQLADKAVDASALYVTHGRNDKRWQEALQVVNALATSDEQARLDLLRLMALTGSLTTAGEYAIYVDIADPRIMSNEVNRVLDAAVSAGLMSATEESVASVRTITSERASQDRRDAPELAAEARASAEARPAMNAGDVFLSLEAWAEAEEMFKLALERPGVDRERALTRLGIAQVRQNKHAEARATFSQVTGARAPVARMWSAYAQSRA